MGSSGLCGWLAHMLGSISSLQAILTSPEERGFSDDSSRLEPHTCAFSREHTLALREQRQFSTNMA